MQMKLLLHVDMKTSIYKTHEILTSMKYINILLLKKYLLRSEMLIAPIQSLEMVSEIITRMFPLLVYSFTFLLFLS